MHAEKRGQENDIDPNEWLELLSIVGIPHLGDVIDEDREAVEAEVGPHGLEGQESHDSQRFAHRRFMHQLGHVPNDITDIM